MAGKRQTSLRGWIKSGPLSPVYVWLRQIVEPLLAFLYRALFTLWPDATRRALSRSLPLLSLKRTIELKIDRDPTFEFNGQRLEYTFHSFNNFRLTERCIEIPIIRDYIERLAPQASLEIGNVSSYYYEAFASLQAFDRRTVVDKYEDSAGVVLSDIADFRPDRKYDFIFSISTFEHMDADRGFNRDYVADGCQGISYAADNIRHVLDELLASGGVFVLTAPIEYSEDWDKTFYSGELERFGASAYRAFGFEKRGEYSWRQVDPECGRSADWTRRRFPEMGFIVVLEFRK